MQAGFFRARGVPPPAHARFARWEEAAELPAASPGVLLERVHHVRHHAPHRKIDITHLAISLIEKRLNDAFPGIRYEVHGTPKDLGGAQALWDRDRYQFQWWAVSLVNAVPSSDKKRGPDGGIDGLLYFKPDGRTTEKAIVSVKDGENVTLTDVKELITTVQHEGARMSVLVSLYNPTSGMRKEALRAGFYETPFGRFPKIQLLTIEELFEGRKPGMPWLDPESFKKAAREDVMASRQGKLL